MKVQEDDLYAGDCRRVRIEVKAGSSVDLSFEAEGGKRGVNCEIG